jgi:23S rRNA pseudouridine1911/1915/1917 synthase
VDTSIIVPRASNVGSSATAHPAGATSVAVLYEDEALLATDKPSGLVVHPAYKHASGTLTDVVYCRQAARGEGRPWLLHRLDRETSGVVLFAKTVAARRALVRQFEHHTVRKLYLAITAGIPTHTMGVITGALRRDLADRRRVVVAPDGRAATTRYAVLAWRGDTALVLARPLTGRTHQIRVHFAARGMPLAGDVTYRPMEGGDHGAHGDAPRVMLHAWCLEVNHPNASAPVRLTAPPPPEFCATLERLGLCLDTQALIRLHCLADSI